MQKKKTITWSTVDWCVTPCSTVPNYKGVRVERNTRLSIGFCKSFPRMARKEDITPWTWTHNDHTGGIYPPQWEGPVNCRGDTDILWTKEMKCCPSEAFIFSNILSHLIDTDSYMGCIHIAASQTWYQQRKYIQISYMSTYHVQRGRLGDFIVGCSSYVLYTINIFWQRTPIFV